MPVQADAPALAEEPARQVNHGVICVKKGAAPTERLIPLGGRSFYLLQVRQKELLLAQDSGSPGKKSSAMFMKGFQLGVGTLGRHRASV